MSKNLISLNKEATLQKWSARISECCRSKLSVKTWCEQNNICVSSYYVWQRRIFQELSLGSNDEPTNFAEIVIEEEPTKIEDVVATIIINDIKVQIHRNAKAQVVAEICKGLRLC